MRIKKLLITRCMTKRITTMSKTGDKLFIIYTDKVLFYFKYYKVEIFGG